MKPLPLALALLVPTTLFGQQAALDRLEKSPRHHEWVEVQRGARTIHAFVAYPEVKDKAPVVMVIHENRGLTDWVRSVADRLAEQGYIAIAPDMLSGAGPSGGRTKDFATSDNARDAIGALKPAEVVADFGAVLDFAKSIPAANGKLAVIGFCWGGSNTWAVALSRQDLAIACPFYGTAPRDADFTKISAPVHGFYGGNDSRVNATLDKTSAGMKEAGKTFEPVVYEGARHAYMRAAEEADANPADKKAADESWKRLFSLLKSMK
jgi:carboxymethylenebutenolidase